MGSRGRAFCCSVLTYRYDHALFSGDSLPDGRSLSGALSFDIAPITLGSETGLSSCPIISAGYCECQSEYTTEDPVGIAVDGWFRVGGHFLVPSIHPARA